MSVRVLSQVFKHSQSVSAGRLVLLVLADEAHDDGVTWVGQPRIALKANVSEDTVRRVQKDLVDLGELDVRKARRGRSTINVYRVLLADEEPDLRRYPAEVAALFSPPQDAGVTKTFTHGSASDSPTDLPRDSSDAPLIGPVRGPVGSSDPGGDVPPIVLIDGQNLPLNALCEECGIDTSSPRLGQALVALNGRHPHVGIRGLFWTECQRWAEAHDGAEILDGMLEDPEKFARALERRIHQKAAEYRERMNGAIISPTALRDWWLDLAHVDEARGAGGNAGFLAGLGSKRR